MDECDVAWWLAAALGVAGLGTWIGSAAGVIRTLTNLPRNTAIGLVLACAAVTVLASGYGCP